MAAIVRTQLQQKAINKVTGVMQDYPLGVEFGELMQKTGYAKSSLYSALSLVGAHKSDDGLWHLPGSQNVVAPVNETAEDDLDDNLDDLATAVEAFYVEQDNGGNTQDDGANIQDKELNTQDPHVSYHDNESSSPDNEEATLLILVLKSLILVLELLIPVISSVSMTCIRNLRSCLITSQATETASQGLAAELKQLDNAYLDGLASKAEAPNAEVSQATVKHYLLIENCTLSLAQDGTGQEPVLAKDIWVDDEGEELEERDCQVMRRAREPLSNWVDFRGVTYRNLFIVNNAQIFHGVFDSIKAAHDKMAELTAKKCGNFFEVLEV